MDAGRAAVTTSGLAVPGGLLRARPRRGRRAAAGARAAAPIPWRASPGDDNLGRIGTTADVLPDETLLAGFGAGDADLAGAFVRRFQRAVYGVALTVLKDAATAEDVAQQTFERAWRHAQVFDPRRGSVRAWLTTIAHNLAVDVVRARRPDPMDPGDLPALLTAMTDTPERLAVAHDNADRLRRALRRLPEPQARAVAMAGIYGMTAPQIAEAEGIPLGTAKTRIRDGMEKLRMAYLPEDVGDE